MTVLPPYSAEDQRIADFLIDYVDDVAPLSELFNKYNLLPDQVGDLITLTDRLRATLVMVQPSADFVEALLQEFGSPRADSPAWWQRVPRAVTSRIPFMPAMPDLSNRTKLAAGIGGLTLMLLTARSLNHFLSMRHRQEAPGEMIA
ncbi:MAG: hypothetical protein Kow0077_09470 [Anaerolineae bacterium]